MPFVSRAGSYILEDDVSGFVYDPVAKENVWVQRSHQKPLTLTSVGDLCFRKDHSSFKEMVFSGDPDEWGMYFYDTPIFRVLTNRMDDTDLWRFYKKFRPQLIGEAQRQQKDFTPTFFYIPQFEDFVVSEFGPTKNFHFPTWLLDIIIADGLIEENKGRTRDNATIRWITDPEVEELYKIYDIRKTQEKDQEDLEIKDIRKQFKEIKDKEVGRRANRAAVHARREKIAERERLDAQAQAEQERATVNK